MTVTTARDRVAAWRARSASRSWPRRLGRVGLGARAAVYVILGALAFDIAFSGTSPTQASSDGALAEVARQPAGAEVLGLLAGGLLAYALWRVAGGLGADDTGEVTGWKRVGWLAAGAVYLGLFAQAVGIVAGRRSSGGPSSHPGPYVGSVLRWPGGPVWVGLAGTAVVVGGIALCIWGIAHDDAEELTSSRLGRRGLLMARATGTFGNLARGLLAGLVGIYLLVGAITDEPGKVKGLDAVLLTVAHRPFGPALLGIAAAGLCSYGIFSVFEARYRRL